MTADLGTTSSADRFDFSNPFFAATIVAADGTRYPLWTRFEGGGPNQATQADLAKAGLKGTKALAFLQELVIENNLSGVPKITATLSPPYRDAINFLDSKLMEWGNTRLEVIYGYVSNSTKAVTVSRPFEGILLKPDVSLGFDVTITLNAQGVGSFSAIRQSGTRTFRNTSRKEIIRQIAEGRVQTALRQKLEEFGPATGGSVEKRAVEVEGGKKALPQRGGAGEERAGLGAFNLNFVREAASIVLNKVSEGAKQREVTILDESVAKNKESDLLYNEQIQYTQGGKTDWQAIYELIRACSCYMLYVGSELKIVPRDSIMGGEPKRVFRLFDFPNGSIGPAAGVFPILSASSPNMAVYLPGASRGFNMTDLDSETRDQVSLFVDDKEVKPTRTGAGASTIVDGPNMASTDGATGDGGGGITPGSPSDGGAVAQARAEYRQHTTDMGVSLNIESLADPTLVPGDNIQVMGIGERLRGVYVVFKQTVTIGGSGASMALECKSNSSNIGGVGTKGASAKEVEPKPETKKIIVTAEEVEANFEGVF